MINGKKEKAKKILLNAMKLLFIKYKINRLSRTRTYNQTIMSGML